MKNKNKTALVVGAAIVASAALIYLFKSENGKKLRKKAKEKGKNVLTSIGTIINDLKSEKSKETSS